MRNTKAIATLVSILTAVLMIFMVSTTVFATGDPGEFVPAPDDSAPTEVVFDDTPQETQAVQEPEQDITQDIVEDDDPDYEPEDNYDDSYDYIGDLDEETQAPTYYEVYGDELPEIESQDVTSPTVVEIPEVEVSDTSLIGGVIAWLCVALGIAVIAGVLVSQRTRQTNGGNNSRRR
ncbi:MAG: hypothetical protein E7513_05885 [Ruminococcaceae bacterium]|nr:hypothetical protein [Oscillospiraceae bacterium]